MIFVLPQVLMVGEFVDMHGNGCEKALLDKFDIAFCVFRMLESIAPQPEIAPS